MCRLWWPPDLLWSHAWERTHLVQFPGIPLLHTWTQSTFQRRDPSAWWSSWLFLRLRSPEDSQDACWQPSRVSLRSKWVTLRSNCHHFSQNDEHLECPRFPPCQPTTHWLLRCWTTLVLWMSLIAVIRQFLLSSIFLLCSTMSSALFLLFIWPLWTHWSRPPVVWLLPKLSLSALQRRYSKTISIDCDIPRLRAETCTFCAIARMLYVMRYIF